MPPKKTHETSDAENGDTALSLKFPPNVKVTRAGIKNISKAIGYLVMALGLSYGPAKDHFHLGTGNSDAPLVGSDKRIRELVEKVDAVSRSLEDIPARFDAIDKRFDGQDKRFDRLDSRVDMLFERRPSGMIATNEFPWAIGGVGGVGGITPTIVPRNWAEPVPAMGLHFGQ